jgi:hypothetical protein
VGGRSKLKKDDRNPSEILNDNRILVGTTIEDAIGKSIKRGRRLRWTMARKKPIELRKKKRWNRSMARSEQ